MPDEGNVGVLEDEDAEITTDAGSSSTGDGDGEDQQAEATDQLGDPGKQALDRMKGKWQTERDKRKAAEARIAELEAAQGGKSADDAGEKGPDPEQVVRDAERAATQKANARILRSEIKAAAAGKLTDPKDALLYLDLDKFEVDADGGVDEDEIAEAIDDLVKKKPYLGAAQGGRRFEGSGDGGARKGGGRPSQLTREALDQMGPDEIVKAKAEGRLDDVLGIKR